jgi:ADP-ribose pyrophosphatase YjhB (NUDIX family)/diadenosine tetraphosphate (Ap4A) HIT family hydrolase
MKLTPEEQQKQILYRDARTTGKYDDIWQSVGKCVFCDLKEKYIFFEENGIVMTVSLFAYIDGQFMIIPRRHVRSTRELTQLEWETVRKFMYIAKKLIREVYDIKGMQFVQREGGITAQSTVEDHLHFQCTPFDAPDLAVWNYRKLKYTPLENVAKYKQARKKIIHHGTKFVEKYQKHTALPIVCDALIVNDKQEILFQERHGDQELVPNYITPPGGLVDRYDVPLEQELAREIKEETGLTTNSSELSLIASQPEDIKRVKQSPHLQLKYVQSTHVLRNTYLIEGVSSKVKLTPGDDCKELIWVPIKEVASHDRISPQIKHTVSRLSESSRAK